VLHFPRVPFNPRNKVGPSIFLSTWSCGQRLSTSCQLGNLQSRGPGGALICSNWRYETVDLANRVTWGGR